MEDHAEVKDNPGLSCRSEGSSWMIISMTKVITKCRAHLRVTAKAPSAHHRGQGQLEGCSAFILVDKTSVEPVQTQGITGFRYMINH